MTGLIMHDTIKLHISKETILLFILAILNLFIVSYSFKTDTRDQISLKRDKFQENLFIRPLVDGKLFAHFQFSTIYRKDIKSLRWENQFEIFPLSLADLVAISDFNRLHFSLTKGNWNHRNWGYLTRPSPPGAQIRVQFSQHNENPQRSWKRLVNSLAGKFCSSLASADEKILISSRLAFGSGLPTSTNHTNQNIYYANLPEETLCTENLTPWKKLLPCYSKSGLATLLNAANLLKSSYSSLAIDIEPIPCIIGNELVVGCEQVQLTQSLSVVFNPLLLFEGRQTWSLAKIFGNSITKQCPLASRSQIHVDITGLDDKSKLYPSTYDKHYLDVKLDENSVETRAYATYDLLQLSINSNSNQPINVGIKQNHLFKQPPASSRSNIPVHFKTHVAGVGANDGIIVATISNNRDIPIRVSYMDVAPHFLRVYLHTLIIKTKSGQELKPDKLNFALSKDSTPTLIEFSLVVPPLTEAQVSYEFERAFLRWTEYKPDANKGVLLGSAVIGVSICKGLNHLVFPIDSVASNASSLECGISDGGEVMRIYARPLLVILPTPDFSMPYNVICLVCTALVALFGALHSVTTRPPVIKVLNDKKKPEKSDEESKKEK